MRQLESFVLKKLKIDGGDGWVTVKKYMTLKYGSMLIEIYFKNKNNKNVGGVERDGEREGWAHAMPFVTY